MPISKDPEEIALRSRRFVARTLSFKEAGFACVNADISPQHQAQYDAVSRVLQVPHEA